MVRESKQFQPVKALEGNVWLKKKKKSEFTFFVTLGIWAVNLLLGARLRHSESGREPGPARGPEWFHTHRGLTHSLFKSAAGSGGTSEKQRSPPRSIDMTTIASGWPPPEGICWTGGKIRVLAAAAKVTCSQPGGRLIQPHLAAPPFGFGWHGTKWQRGRVNHLAAVRPTTTRSPLKKLFHSFAVKNQIFLFD